jgi:hypothetical protein
LGLLAFSRSDHRRIVLSASIRYEEICASGTPDVAPNTNSARFLGRSDDDIAIVSITGIYLLVSSPQWSAAELKDLDVPYGGTYNFLLDQDAS